MANIPQNDTYQNASGTQVSSGGFNYSPKTTYRNIGSKLPSSSFNYSPKTSYQNLGKFPAAPTPAPGSFEEYQAKQAGILQYGNLLNNGMGVPTGTQFLPPTGDINAPIPIPSDYGSFAEPMSFTEGGEKLSWGTPTSPVIKNISGDVPGQYVEDIADPNLLVKTVRGKNSMADAAIRNYRSSTMYQIDHIMPLNLGGADTLANRQYLTYDQNDAKTKAQSIPLS